MKQPEEGEEGEEGERWRWWSSAGLSSTLLLSTY